MSEPVKHLSLDRALKDGFTLHPKDEEALLAIKSAAQSPLPDDMAAARAVGAFLTPPGLEEHAAALNLYFQIMSGIMRKVATEAPEVLQWVRELRLQKRYSWRMIAQAVSDRHGAPWMPPWNQVGGMAVCKAAAEATGDDFMEPPWN